MRVSADENDPGYGPLCTWAVVYLDGRRQEHVVTADEEQGAIVFYPDGYPMLDDRLVKHVAKGEVRIAVMADAPDWLKQEFPDRVVGA